MAGSSHLNHEIFDVVCDADKAQVQILPMPFDATTSYRPGAAHGPEAIWAASVQVDLCDADVGAPHVAGIHLAHMTDVVIERNQHAQKAVQRIRQAKEDEREPHQSDFDDVNKATQKNNVLVYEWTQKILENHQLPVILGGDHSVPFGAIKACAEQYGNLGILHIDAHCDLRQTYEGFSDSHASIMNNVQQHIPQVTKLVQVGIRDFCEEEVEIIRNSKGRIVTFFDQQLRRYRLEGRFVTLCQTIVDKLPEHVYISFDIDGLDPTLCPSTGTPVPGGLSFDEVVSLLECLAKSGKKVVGMDLCEVSPPRDTPKIELGAVWDANVGARILYKLIGFALISRKTPGVTPPQLPSW